MQIRCNRPDLKTTALVRLQSITNHPLEFPKGPLSKPRKFSSMVKRWSHAATICEPVTSAWVVVRHQASCIFRGLHQRHDRNRRALFGHVDVLQQSPPPVRRDEVTHGSELFIAQVDVALPESDDELEIEVLHARAPFIDANPHNFGKTPR